jgi:hypothetical protein
MIFNKHKSFRKKTLEEIQCWAWLAIVLPISSLAAVFFIWVYGTSTMLDIAMIVGSSAMFTVAVIWWWWALYAINTLIQHWDETRDKVKEVSKDIGSLKTFIQEVFRPSKDK